MSDAAASYDALPYGSTVVAETHPEVLAATAALMGLAPPDSVRGRILELGCAEGGNLIPLAFDLPHAEFVGVDISAQQVAAGRALVAELGLNNIRLELRDVAAGLGDLGRFDFIIAHGLYSWVPPAVRTAILAACAGLLRPGGIAYVSFNVLPGWRMRGVLREFLRPRVDAAAPPARQAAQARTALAAALPAWRARTSHEAQLLATEAAQLLEASPSYLFHEYLTECNAPCLFADFVAAAEAAGLRYVADTDLTAMLPGAAAAEAVAALDAGERIAREQLLDYLGVRKFRRALLTHRDAAVADWPQAPVVRELAFHADLTCDEELDFAAAVPQHFRLPGGGQVTISHPLAKAAAMLLASACPARVAFADLLAGARDVVERYGSAEWREDAAGFEREWIELWAQQAVQPATSARRYPQRIAARPLAHALARALARRRPEGAIVATARHGALRLDAAGTELLLACDGSRDAAALVATYALQLPDGAGEVTQVAQAAVSHLLQTFLRAGLLIGE